MPITVKRVKGIRYLYFSHYDSKLKKKIETYCGPADNPDAVDKANALQKEYLQDKHDRIQLQIDELERYKGTRRKAQGPSSVKT